MLSTGAPDPSEDGSVVRAGVLVSGFRVWSFGTLVQELKGSRLHRGSSVPVRRAALRPCRQVAQRTAWRPLLLQSA